MIIILVVVIVILAAVIGFMVLKPMHAKEPTKLKITSNDTLYEGKDLTFKLADLNKTPLSNQKVNITIKNSKGKVVANKTVKTNDNGNAKMDLNLKKGKYEVLVAYGGNENYTGNNTTQKLTIKEEVKQTVSGESSSSSSSGYTTEPVYDGHTLSYKDGVRGVYSPSGEFFVDPTQDPNYRTF